MPPPEWANATNKFAVRDLDGSKVLVKLAENDFAFAKRCRPFFGSTEMKQLHHRGRRPRDGAPPADG